MKVARKPKGSRLTPQEIDVQLFQTKKFQRSQTHSKGHATRKKKTHTLRQCKHIYILLRPRLKTGRFKNYLRT